MTREREDIRILVYASPWEWQEAWEEQLDLIMEEESYED